MQHRRVRGAYPTTTNGSGGLQRRSEPCYFSGGGGHLVVRLGDKMTDLPIHGGNKELKKGLIEGVKKRLGLK